MNYIQLMIQAPSAWEDILTGLLFAYGAPGVEVEDPAIIAAHLAAGDWDASVFAGQNIQVGQVILRSLFLSAVPPGLYDDIAALGGDITVSCQTLPNRDWQQVWRQSFPTLMLGNKLAVTPYWRQDEIPKGALPLYISPGLAFGTGDHATTALVAEMMQQYLPKGQRVLDIGCGSGILAIAALKLGAKQALAIDIDAACEASVDEHRNLNGLSREDLPFLWGDILCDKSLQVICRDFGAALLLSNIVAGVIEQLAGRAKDYLQPGGLWISSGILAEKEAGVQKALAAYNWQIIQRCVRGEWVALAARSKYE